MIRIIEGMQFRNPSWEDTGWTVIRDRGPMVDILNHRTDSYESHSKLTIQSYLARGEWEIIL